MGDAQSDPEALLRETEQRIAAINVRKRVSIDQCFLLDMVEGAPAAVALRTALEIKVAEGRLLCPIHPEESVFESSLVRPELRQRVFDLQRSLALGYCFHGFGQRLSREVMAFLLNRPLPPIWPRPFHPPDGSVEALSGINRTGRDAYQERLDAVVPPPEVQERDFERILTDLTRFHNRSFQRILVALDRVESLPTPPEVWEYVVDIGTQLRRLGLSRPELTRLHSWIERDGWHSSPALVAFTRLWAAVEEEGLRNNRRTRANDQLDILRLAVGFADGDAVLCDSAMAGFVRKARLPDVLPGRQVFGMREMEAATAWVMAL